jgi:hypothetical protein
MVFSAFSASPREQVFLIYLSHKFIDRKDKGKPRALFQLNTIPGFVLFVFDIF